jgi:hypothetical protein
MVTEFNDDRSAMILPRTGAGLPAWRRHVSAWVMGALRLGAAWVGAHTPLFALTGGAVSSALPAAVRWSAAGAIVLGGLLFAWSRTVLVGFTLLAIGLVVYMYGWEKIGFQRDPLVLRMLMIMLVLTVGELLVRRVQKKLYS